MVSWHAIIYLNLDIWLFIEEFAWPILDKYIQTLHVALNPRGGRAAKTGLTDEIANDHVHMLVDLGTVTASVWNKDPDPAYILTDHIGTSPCAFHPKVVPIQPFTDTASYYQMLFENGPPPLLQNAVGKFHGGSRNKPTFLTNHPKMASAPQIRPRSKYLRSSSHQT